MMMLQDEEASSKIVSRKVWARKWLLQTPEKGVFHTIFKELALQDSGGFREFIRMPDEKFRELSSLFFIVNYLHRIFLYSFGRHFESQFAMSCGWKNKPIVEFRIPGYPGQSKEQGTEVRLMRGKIFGAKYECSCSFMLFTNTILNDLS